MGLLGGFKGKLKGTKQKSRKSISSQVVCVKYKVHSEFDSDNNYPSSSRQNGEITAVVNQKKPRVIPDAQNLFQPSAVKTSDLPAPCFKTVAPKSEVIKSDALKAAENEVDKVSKTETKPKVREEGTKKKSSKTKKAAAKPNSAKADTKPKVREEEIKKKSSKAAAEPNPAKVDESKTVPKENEKDGKAKSPAPKSPIFKTITPKTGIEKADSLKVQKAKKENAETNEVPTQMNKEERKSPPKPKSPIPNEAKDLNKIVKPKKKQAPKAKAPKKEAEKKPATPTPTKKADVKNQTESAKSQQKNEIKSESPNNVSVTKPDENSNIYAAFNNADDDKEESFKIHVVDHANSFYSNLSDAETTEAEDNDDFKFVQRTNPHSPINYSSQAASIFFGGEEEIVVRPRNVVMNDDDVSQGSSASA